MSRVPFRQQVVQLVNRVHKPERDPGRAARVYAEYDQGRRYAEYHEHCRAACVRDFEDSEPGAVERDGFSYLRGLGAERAQQVADELQRDHELELLKKDSRDLEGFRVSDRRWLETLYSDLLVGETDRAIAAYFRSEYLVHWSALSLNHPAEEQSSVSFRWHCDKGPSAHLKLIVYLNPTGEHGGNTEFINRADTDAVARQGYLFGWSKSRTDDIGRLSRLAGRPLGSEMRERDAGEAVLFQPSRVLHRGVSPTRGARLTATLCILPSPVPWLQAWRSNAAHDLAVDDKWHDDAMSLLDRLARRPAP